MQQTKPRDHQHGMFGNFSHQFPEERRRRRRRWSPAEIIGLANGPFQLQKHDLEEKPDQMDQKHIKKDAKKMRTTMMMDEDEELTTINLQLSLASNYDHDMKGFEGGGDDDQATVSPVTTATMEKEEDEEEEESMKPELIEFLETADSFQRKKTTKTTKKMREEPQRG